MAMQRTSVAGAFGYLVTVVAKVVVAGLGVTQTVVVLQVNQMAILAGAVYLTIVVLVAVVDSAEAVATIARQIVARKVALVVEEA